MKTFFPLALSFFVEKYSAAAKRRISRFSPTGFTRGDLLLSRLGRHTDFATHQMPTTFQPLPPTSPPSRAPHTTAIPFHFPKSCPPSDLGCKLPEPPALSLAHPGRLRGRAGSVRQAVTDTARKKQCSTRKKTVLLGKGKNAPFLKNFACWSVRCRTTVSWHALFM